MDSILKCAHFQVMMSGCETRSGFTVAKGLSVS